MAAASAWADIELPSVPPPQPEAVTAKVFLGESVEIPLKGLSRSGQALEFLIRRKPSSGSLSEIVPTSRSSATVVYTPGANAGPGIDRFRFAVRAPGIGVSTPAEVLIYIAERPPVFVSPAVLDFGAVAVGQSRAQSFEIRNDGGGLIQGRLKVSPPWKLVGDGGYALGPGQTREFTVTFAPLETSRFSGNGVYSHADNVIIGLEGRGFAPVETVPREVRLEGNGRDEVRTGGFLVRNVSEQARKFVLKLPAGVTGPAEVEVPARAEVPVALQTTPGFLDSLNAPVTLIEGDLVLTVPMRVMAAPPRLVVEPAAVDFGTLVAGRYGRATVSLRNTGGSAANLRATLPDGVILSPDPTIETLPAGQTRKFEVSFAHPTAGALDAPLELAAGGIGVTIPLRATVEEGRKLAAREGATVAGVEGGNETAAATPSPTPTADIPPVEQIGVSRQTKTEVDLVWRKSSPNVMRYGLVMREIKFGPKGDAYFKYTPLERVKPRFVRDEVRATLSGLRPGESVTLFVVGYDAAGVPSPASPPLTVATKPSPPFRFPWFWVGAVFVGLCVAALIRERRRQRRLLDAEVPDFSR